MFNVTMEWSFVLCQFIELDSNTLNGIVFVVHVLVYTVLSC